MANDEEFRSKLPRSMEGEGLKIVPAYTEAGYFGEANVVTITDGVRTAKYVPMRDNVVRIAETDARGSRDLGKR